MRHEQHGNPLLAEGLRLLQRSADTRQAMLTVQRKQPFAPIKFEIADRVTVAVGQILQIMRFVTQVHLEGVPLRRTAIYPHHQRVEEPVLGLKQVMLDIGGAGMIVEPPLDHVAQPGILVDLARIGNAALDIAQPH